MILIVICAPYDGINSKIISATCEKTVRHARTVGGLDNQLEGISFFASWRTTA